VVFLDIEQESAAHSVIPRCTRFLYGEARFDLDLCATNAWEKRNGVRGIAVRLEPDGNCAPGFNRRNETRGMSGFTGLDRRALIDVILQALALSLFVQLETFGAVGAKSFTDARIGDVRSHFGES